MSDTFDLISQWTSSEPSGRCLWVLNKKTGAISWKSRKVYSCWQTGATARLQTIFNEMSAHLPENVQANDRQQFNLVYELRRRVTHSYDHFLKAHRSIFGIIYRFLFAYFLSDAYKHLKGQLDNILASSLSNLEITDLPPHEIEAIVKLVGKQDVPPTFNIDWKSLSYAQFIWAHMLEPYAKPMLLKDLDKEKVTFILTMDGSKIQQFQPEEISDNLQKIEPRFLKELSSKQVERLPFSQLTGQQFIHLPSYYHLYKHHKALNLDHFTATDLSFITQHSNVISNCSPQTVASNLAKLEPSSLKSLSKEQIEELDFATLTSEQILHLPSYHGKEKQWHQIDLSNYTTPSIAKILEKSDQFIKKLSPKTVAANISRIATRYYLYLTEDQIKAIDYTSLNDVQREAFGPYDMKKMANYPKVEAANAAHHFFFGETDWSRDYFSDFFGGSSAFSSPRKGNSSRSYSYFGISEEWWRNFCKPNRKASHKTETTSNKDIVPYQKALDSACQSVSEHKQVNSNPLYEKLRKKCIDKKNALKNDPRLVFVDEVKMYDASRLKEYYRKLLVVIHPDKATGPEKETTELFKLASEAYKYLSTS